MIPDPPAWLTPPLKLWRTDQPARWATKDTSLGIHSGDTMSITDPFCSNHQGDFDCVEIRRLFLRNPGDPPDKPEDDDGEVEDDNGVHGLVGG